MADPIDLDNLLTIGEAGKLIGRSSRTVRRWAADGELKAYRVKQRLLIPKTELLKMLVPAFPVDEAR